MESKKINTGVVDMTDFFGYIPRIMAVKGVMTA